MKNISAHKYRVDVLLFLLMLALTFHKLTGDAIHEWLGIVLVLPLLWHICLNWGSLANGLRNFFGKLSAGNRFNLLWNILLYAVLGITTLTGILISRDFLPRLGVTIPNDAFMSYVHKQIVPVLMVMLGIHLGVHYRWIMMMTFRRPGPVTAETSVAPKEQEEVK